MELWESRVEIAAAFTAQTDEALLESGCEGWTLLEDAIARRAWIIGIFGSKAEAEARWADLRVSLGEAPLGAPEVRLLADADWKNSYKEHFRAWTFGRLHWVPVWEKEAFRLPPGDAVLWLDPGLAFGTGNHETTRLCIERMVAFESTLAGRPAGALRMVDAGCGSGILALSAALLGFGSVRGFDNDPEAVRVSHENATLNGLSGRVSFTTGGITEGLRGEKADFIAANIQADILMRFAPDLVSALAPGGVLALSGILATESVCVRSVFSGLEPGWTLDTRVLGEWSDLCLSRPAA